MPPPKRSRHGEALDALIAVAPLVSRWIERLLANATPPLTLVQLSALRAIGGGVESSATLARAAGVSAPAVSQLVAGLVERGLVERAASAGDRRRLALRLSRAGARALAGADAMLRTRLAGVIGELPPPE
ncbi:MAG TPA: helix-turn-helix domain-containing protein, partial [Solirubrobacteraceae bacterium]|nr:helix-turn-helix domain-containing protein [Solirubrobacteraceae bacterium]